jgi:tetratricopeptide (TPR) repeat protein
MLADALEKMDLRDEAKAAYERALELEPDHPGAHAGLASLLALKTANAAKAESHFRLALKAAPRSMVLWHRLGNMLLDKEDYEGAVQALRKASELRPDQFASQIMLAQALSKLEKHEEAIQAARRAIELDPEYSMTHSIAAQVFERAGRLEDAIAEGREAIRLVPKFQDSELILAVILANAGRHDEAVPLFATLVNAQPAQNDLRLRFASSLFQAKHYFPALDYVQMATRIEPDSIDAHILHAKIAIKSAEAARLNQPMDRSYDQMMRRGAFTSIQHVLRLLDPVLTGSDLIKRDEAKESLRELLHSDFDSVRQAKQLQSLAEDERTAWAAVWSKVEMLLGHDKSPAVDEK